MGCFVVLKRVYGDFTARLTRDRVDFINKLNFLTTFREARAESYKLDTIQKFFVKAGLVPLYSPNQVILGLKIKVKTFPPPQEQLERVEALKPL